WKVDYMIAHKPIPGERIQPATLEKVVKLCGAPEYEFGDYYLARLESDCDQRLLDAAKPRPAMIVPGGLYDDFDPAVVFKGEWSHDESFDGPSGHTVSYTDIPGAEATIHFDGSTIAYVFTKAPNRGVAEILIDGQSKAIIDLYSPDVNWQTMQAFDVPVGR